MTFIVIENITLTKYLAKRISDKAAEETHFAPIFEQHCLIVRKNIKKRCRN